MYKFISFPAAELSISADRTSCQLISCFHCVLSAQQ
jgi:hypothetical protein